MKIIIPMSHQVCPVAFMIICKDIKLSSTMLRKHFQRCCEVNDQMSTGGVHKTVPEKWQIQTRTTQNAALQCSYEQETDNSSNLYWITSTMSVIDDLNYVMALEDSRSQNAMLKILAKIPGQGSGKFRGRVNLLKFLPFQQRMLMVRGKKNIGYWSSPSFLI